MGDRLFYSVVRDSIFSGLGGATFGRFHLGLIKALYDQDLLPRIVCGSSVGSIIGAFICSKKYSDLPKILSVSYF